MEKVYGSGLLVSRRMDRKLQCGGLRCPLFVGGRTLFAVDIEGFGPDRFTVARCPAVRPDRVNAIVPSNLSREHVSCHTDED
jgi:hypothetical protein